MPSHGHIASQSGFVPRRIRRRRVRGISPLEMVLCLPILLFMMALIINFGTVSSWKARCWMVTRQGLTSNRVIRPDYWPASAGMGGGHGGTINVPNFPDVTDLAPNELFRVGGVMNEDLMDPRKDLRHQSSSLTRQFPLMQKMGNYRLRSRIWIMDDEWTFWDDSMTWPEYGGHIWRNERRRIPVTFVIPSPDLAPFLDYAEAVYAVLDPVLQANLKVLDDDDEFDYYRRLYFGTQGSPDFHPRLSNRGFCTLLEADMQIRVDQLINRVAGPNRSVPRTMHDRFRDLYERVIEELQARIDADPPPSPSEIAAMEAEIAALEAKLELLAEFDLIVSTFEAQQRSQQQGQQQGQQSGP